MGFSNWASVFGVEVLGFEQNQWHSSNILFLSHKCSSLMSKLSGLIFPLCMVVISRGRCCDEHKCHGGRAVRVDGDRPAHGRLSASVPQSMFSVLQAYSLHI